MSEIDFQRVFGNLPGMFLVFRADPAFTIVAASAEMLAASHCHAGILGRPLFDVFPDNPGDPAADGSARLRESLARVIATRSADSMPVQRHDVRRAGAPGGSFEERYWLPVNTPVLGDDGEVEYIVQRVEEPRSKGQRDALLVAGSLEDRELAALESERKRLIYEASLNATPDFFYVFDLEHRALYANQALLKVWGVDDVRGKTWVDLGYEQWHADMHDAEIDRVIATRAPIRSEIPFTGTNGTRIYDYIFAPVFSAEGDVVAIAGVTRDITERQAVEQSVREQAVSLAEADRAKDEFLATLAHELRNPLAPLRNAIELLRRGGMEPQDSAPVLAMMERQVHHLVRLVDDLLEVSRISRGVVNLRKERIELATVVRNAVETSDPLIRGGNHALSVQLPTEPLWLEGDPVRLAQILANLLSNAAKYTPDGGRIHVQARREGDVVAIGVEDDGEGIPSDQLPRMFEMFSRGDRDSGRSQGGLGIGLALARRLAEMHQGSLDAHSNGPGQGSEFTVRLPLSQEGVATVVQPPVQAAPLSRTRVLVVDDNHDAGDSMAMVLGLLGAEVHVERDGASAVVAFGSWNPTVVLLDIGMPGMNGYDVARSIRARYPASKASLVALTGWGQDEDRRRARDAGFDHHLVKPAELEALQQLLRTLEPEAG